MNTTTDERWARLVESTTEREDWDELWQIALTAPPIWTIRILKFLGRKSWKPPADCQLALFESLSNLASSCNEFELPGPDLRLPVTVESCIPGERITTARITADGQLVFVVDDSASSVEVRTVDDLATVERLRLDIDRGKRYAVLAIDVDCAGSQLAALLYEPGSRTAIVRLFEFSFGELQGRTHDIAVPTEGLTELSLRPPKLRLDSSSGTLLLLTGDNRLHRWSLADGTPSLNIHAGDQQPRNGRLSQASGLSEWRKFGRHSMGKYKSRYLFLSKSGSTIAASQGMSCDLWLDVGSSTDCRLITPATLDSWSLVSCCDDLFTLTPCGSYIVQSFYNNLWLRRVEDYARLSEQQRSSQLQKMRDLALTLVSCQEQDLSPCLQSFETLKADNVDLIMQYPDMEGRLAIGHNSDVLAVAAPHGARINIYHLPDGRALGTLPGLAREPLADFRFTSGGSLVAVTRSGKVQIWEADNNGIAWPWSEELVAITHHPLDESSVELLRQAQVMRHRGWLSSQESSLLDLCITLLQSRLSLDIEIDVINTELPGDIYDIEIE